MKAHVVMKLGRTATLSTVARFVARGAVLATSAALLANCTGEIGAPVGPLPPGGASVSGPNDDQATLVNGNGQALDCTQIKVGATPLQRLTRSHYVNSVRDLLQIGLDGSSLPEDEKVGVFDGNAVVPVSDFLLETYAGTAETAARSALPKIEALVPCDRTKLGDAACAAQFIDRFGERVYRRPLDADEHTSYVTLFDAYKAAGYPDALRVIVQTMLQSPNFLYRAELTPVQPGTQSTTLTAYELAARLSFFLVSTTPDAELLAAARSGELLSSAGLNKQVERLANDAHFSDTLDSFHTQWLELDPLDDLSKDPALFPLFTPDIGAKMRTETLRFARYVLTKDDATLKTLLTAPYSFPEGPLLDLYRVKASAADADGRIALDPSQRAGLLTQPAFLAAHAHYDQGAPVLRGKVVIRNILCQVLPDPPPNVNTTPPDRMVSATTRERLAEHATNPACGGCHDRIDGIGFGFEQFDALGGFRSMEAGKQVDASGTIHGTKTSDGDFNGVPELARKLSDSTEAQQCMTKQWLRFALGRLEAEADQCTLERLFRDFTKTGYDIRALLQSIATSDAFRSKRVASESTP